jgi:hypothetical protein
VRLLIVLVVISCALVIVAISAAVNRRRESLPYSARTSGTDNGTWMAVMSGMAWVPPTVPARTPAAGVMEAVEVATKIGTRFRIRRAVDDNRKDTELWRCAAAAHDGQATDTGLRADVRFSTESCNGQ